MKFYIAIAIILSSFNSFSQEKEEDTSKKHKLYFYWGYNRATFTKSNIHFKGDEYGFTLNGVRAKDRQSAVQLQFIDPTKLSIPQYNYRIGYYLDDKWIVSLGWDHMKYVMVSEQDVTIDGEINTSYSEKFGGSYSNIPFAIDKSFLEFEHSDGLNYLSPQIDRNFVLWESKNKDYSLVNSAGLGLGIIIPKSNVTLMHNEKNDKWHLAGYGFSANTNMRFTFLKYFFLEYNLKGGFINMPDVLTTSNKSDRANHSFFFLERFTVGGFTFTL